MSRLDDHSSESADDDLQDPQQSYWNQTYHEKPGMYGRTPSAPAQTAADLFDQEGANVLLELGGGHGRDTLFFAQRHFRVTVLDYSTVGLAAIVQNALDDRLAERVTALHHDVRHPLPFPDEAFDACFSHMLFSMAMSTHEQVALAHEVRRVLRSGGIHVFTVRHTGDAQYGVGIPHGEDRFETGGFEVHFFNLARVELLAQEWELISIQSFEEGTLPRRIWSITLRKPS